MNTLVSFAIATLVCLILGGIAWVAEGEPTPGNPYPVDAWASNCNESKRPSLPSLVQAALAQANTTTERVLRDELLLLLPANEALATAWPPGCAPTLDVLQGYARGAF